MMVGRTRVEAVSVAMAAVAFLAALATAVLEVKAKRPSATAVMTLLLDLNSLDSLLMHSVFMDMDNAPTRCFDEV